MSLSRSSTGIHAAGGRFLGPDLKRPIEKRRATKSLGAKGCGEAGCAGSMTSVMNAVVDALLDVGINHFDMPASPPRVWAAIQKARS